MQILSGLLRLNREVRVTFLPYAWVSIGTSLSPEQCQERLSSATQPQKMLALVHALTSPDAHLVFKGQVTRAGFLAVPVDRKGWLQGPEPFCVRGSFKPASGGTDVVVQVFPDLYGLVVCCVLLGFAVGQTALDVQQLQTPGTAGRVLRTIAFPWLLVRDLVCWAIIALPASFEAYKIKKILYALL